MTLSTAQKEYKKLGEYFAPDYAQENEILLAFKKVYPTLSNEQALKLKSILQDSQDWTDKYFGTDLLYLYDKFDEVLLEPLINCAIAFPDPSFNRIFLRPCINAFGIKRVAALLKDKFTNGDSLQRIRIASLVYWLKPEQNGDADLLHTAIIERAATINNLVELYFYKLQYNGKNPNSSQIPENALDLMKAINGNKELEDPLYNKLNWQRNNVS